MRAFDVRMEIGCESALQAASAAVAAATSMVVRVNVAVVDGSGILVAYLRMNGAPLHSQDIAQDKAYTAASFGIATSLWSARLASSGEMLRQGLMHRPRFVALGGGQPIRIDSELVGAIGVSGGSEEQDEACALAGLRAIGADMPRDEQGMKIVSGDG